jgi:preprotein translocase subunit SecF
MQLFPLRLVPDDTRIPFMRYARVCFAASLAVVAASLILLFTVGLNTGIDFKGGTLIEVQSTAPVADLADIRARLSALDLGETEVQGFGTPNDVLIRLEAQPGGDEAQQAALARVQQALGSEDYSYRRIEVVGPKVSSELARTGTVAVIVTMVGVLFYIWFRFEWQFAIGAILNVTHDVALTMGFFVVTQIEFNLSSIAAVLTIVGYSLNDTVVIYDRIREMLRKYKQMPIEQLLDRSLNEMLSRTVTTSMTTILALLALFLFGGEVIRSFTAAMLFGVVEGIYSTIFIAVPVLIFFRLRPSAAPQPAAAKA